jgi:protocatechuate 3,4-dioxygenase beta subunit
MAVVGGTQSSGARGNVRGVVIDGKSGDMIVGATVKLSAAWTDEPLAETESGPDGMFTFSGVAVGRYRIAGGAQGYVDLIPSWSTSRIVAVTLTEAQVVKLVLTPAAVVSGRVVDGTGQPIRGVSVVPFARRLVGGAVRLLPKGGGAQADDRGEYRLHGLAPGVYTVAAVPLRWREGNVFPQVYFPGEMSSERARYFTLSAGERRSQTDIVVPESPRLSITGMVSVGPADWSGRAIMVSLWTKEGFAIGAAQADAEGRFRFEGVPAGEYHLVGEGPVMGLAAAGPVTGSNARRGRVAIEVGGQDLTEVVVPLRPPAELKGQVRVVQQREPQIDCLSRAELVLHPTGTTVATAEVTSRIDDRGRLRFPRLFPDTYQVFLRHADQRCFIEAVMQGKAGIEDRIITLGEKREWEELIILISTEAGSVQGRVVTVTEEPVEATWVCLVPESRKMLEVDTELATVTTGPDGRFEFPHVQHGRYRLVAVRPMDSMQALDPVVCSEKQGEGVQVAVKGGEEVRADLRVGQ